MTRTVRNLPLLNFDRTIFGKGRGLQCVERQILLLRTTWTLRTGEKTFFVFRFTKDRPADSAHLQAIDGAYVNNCLPELTKR
jgi:hypothetical protein